MRLALVTETFPPEVNGVSMTLGRLVSGLAERGHEVQVVRPIQPSDRTESHWEDRGFSELIVPGVPLPGYNGLRMGMPEAYRLLKNWNEFGPDLVHVATEGPLGMAALWISHVLRIPVTSTYHTNFHQYTGHYRIGLIRDFILVFLRITHNECGCTLAPTREMVAALRAVGFKNVGVLSRGVDTVLFSPERRDEGLRRAWGVEPDGRVFLYVGRVASEKNIELAIDAFRQASAGTGGAVMVVVGDGPERTRLEEAHPDIVFAGMRKGEDLARHYASGDVFLFPSITETYGNVVAEALSSGLAVVTYDYAAGREWIENGVNGFVAPFDCESSFRNQAMNACSLESDTMSGIRVRARETALQLGWDRVVGDFERSLKTVKRKYDALFASTV